MNKSGKSNSYRINSTDLSLFVIAAFCSLLVVFVGYRCCRRRRSAGKKKALQRQLKNKKSREIKKGEEETVLLKEIRHNTDEDLNSQAKDKKINTSSGSNKKKTKKNSKSSISPDPSEGSSKAHKKTKACENKGSTSPSILGEIKLRLGDVESGNHSSLNSTRQTSPSANTLNSMNKKREQYKGDRNSQTSNSTEQASYTKKDKPKTQRSECSRMRADADPLGCTDAMANPVKSKKSAQLEGLVKDKSKGCCGKRKNTIGSTCVGTECKKCKPFRDDTNASQPGRFSSSTNDQLKSTKEAWLETNKDPEMSVSGELKSYETNSSPRSTSSIGDDYVKLESPSEGAGDSMEVSLNTESDHEMSEDSSAHEIGMTDQESLDDIFSVDPSPLKDEELLHPSPHKDADLLPCSLRKDGELLPPSLRKDGKLLPPSLCKDGESLTHSLRKDGESLPPSLRKDGELLPHSLRKDGELLPCSLRKDRELLPPSLGKDGESLEPPLHKEKELFVNYTDSPVRIESIGDVYDVMEYATREWKGDTTKAHAIRKGYFEVPKIMGLNNLRVIRGDNYCAIRATLFQALVKRIPILEKFKNVQQIPKRLFSEGYDWIKDWNFGARLRVGRNEVCEGMEDCLKELVDLVNLNNRMEGEGRVSHLLSFFNYKPIDYELRLLEAIKVLMMASAVELHKLVTSEQDVPVFAIIMFARDSSPDPHQFLKKHLNAVGDSGGLEQVEMHLLGYTLGITIQVVRPSCFGQSDFIVHYPEDMPRGTPSVTLVAEDDRHYNVLG